MGGSRWRPRLDPWYALVEALRWTAAWVGHSQPVKVAGTSRPTARCAVRQHMLCSEHIWCGRGEEGR